MGDRANIIVRERDEQVVIYQHWAGTGLFVVAKEAMDNGRDRWDDFQYLTAILLRHVFKRYDPKLTGTTGIGISHKIGDNEHPILILDVAKQEAFYEDEQGKVLSNSLSFDDFCSKELALKSAVSL
jgi:hypothetical protein